jgi:hypothetical protein
MLSTEMADSLLRRLDLDLLYLIRPDELNQSSQRR